MATIRRVQFLYVNFVLLSKKVCFSARISAEAIGTYPDIGRTQDVQEGALHRGPPPLHLKLNTSPAFQKPFTDAWGRGFIIVNEAGLVSRLDFRKFYSGSVSGSKPYYCGRYRRACLLIEP